MSQPVEYECNWVGVHFQIKSIYQMQNSIYIRDGLTPTVKKLKRYFKNKYFNKLVN